MRGIRFSSAWASNVRVILLLVMQGERKNKIRKIWYKFCSLQ
jgi:hypothetical protein